MHGQDSTHRSLDARKVSSGGVGGDEKSLVSEKGPVLGEAGKQKPQPLVRG